MGALLAVVIKRRQDDDLIDISCLLDSEDDGDEFEPLCSPVGYVICLAIPLLIMGLIFATFYFIH